MKIESVSDSNYTNLKIENDNQNNVQQASSANAVNDDKIRNSLATSEAVQQIHSVRKEGQTISEKALQEAIDKVNKVMVGSQRELKYSVHEKTKEIIVKVINTDTGDVVREIPSEKILNLVARLQELVGIFVNEKR